MFLSILWLFAKILILYIVYFLYSNIIMSSVASSDENIPDRNCIRMMRFMTQHPTQSHDPKKALIAIVHDAVNIKRVALLVSNSEKRYRIIERNAAAFPESLYATDCHPMRTAKFIALIETLDVLFCEVTDILEEEWGDVQSIHLNPPRFNVQGCSINIHKHK